MPKCETEIPDPLAHNLPEFLPRLRVGAPAIGVFFDIFIGKHGLESAASVVQIQQILDEKPRSVQIGEEELIDPLPHALAYLHLLVWGRCRMSSHNHPNVRQALPQFHPSSIKQLNDLTGVHARHLRCRWMSQYALDLGMLQELIPFPPCH
jgi:hypothetical protein